MLFTDKRVTHVSRFVCQKFEISEKKGIKMTKFKPGKGT